MADLTDYTGLITSEHNQRPKFMAAVKALTKPMVALQNLLGGMPDAFDLDQAVGVQLDAVGLWVGIGRRVATPLTGVYFSLDTTGVGFDQGNWKGPFDPDTGLTLLDDDTYRLVLRAKIGANHWDGTLESSAAILNSIFTPGDGPVAVHADAEPFGAGDGATTQFQLLYHGQPVYQVDSAALYRNDWQGNQQLYPTARRNLATWSGDFTNAAWPRNDATMGATILGPDGVTAVPKLVEGSLNSSHWARWLSNMQIGVPYIASIFFKAGERSRGYIWGSNTTVNGGGVAWFDLTTGTVGGNNITGGEPTISDVGNGWYKCTVKFPNTQTAAQQLRYGIYSPTSGSATYQGDGVSGLYPFGAHVTTDTELGAYIHTTSSSVIVTDYTLGPSGIAQLAVPPAAGAALTWTGDGEIYPSGTYVFIQDNQDMSMTIGVAGKVPSSVFLALLEGGYIPLKPEGVRVNYVIVTSVDGVPMFGFDVANQFVMGFDSGAWGTPL